MKKQQKIYLVIKRLIDIFGSIIGTFVCFSFLWWWIFIINLFVTHGRPFFVTGRIGKNGKEFGLLKFRSMKSCIDPNLTSEEIKEIDENPYTKFGKFLRKTSLDETLQVLNVFVGQMSFIGPRPLLDKNQDHTTIELRKESGAIKLAPGISGYAQINGRIDISAGQKAELDKFYFENFSFWLDFRIFIITLLQPLGFFKKKIY